MKHVLLTNCCVGMYKMYNIGSWYGWVLLEHRLVRGGGILPAFSSTLTELGSLAAVLLLCCCGGGIFYYYHLIKTEHSNSLYIYYTTSRSLLLCHLIVTVTIDQYLCMAASSNSIKSNQNQYNTKAHLTNFKINKVRLLEYSICGRFVSLYCVI